MKILMTTDTYFPKIGGAEVHVFELRRELERRGHAVILYTTKTTKDRESDQNLFRLEWRHNWVSHFKKLWSLSKDCDVIHSHFAYRLAFLAGLVAVLRGKPFYITEHGYGILNHPGAAPIYQCVHSFYRFWSLQFARMYISTSEDLAVPARKYIKEKKICIIPNGVSFTTFSDAAPCVRPAHISADAKIILTVRRLVPKNGIQYLAAVYKDIVKSVPNVHWIMIGDGQCKDEIVDRLQRDGVFDKVTMMGAVQNSEISGYYKIADCVVFPSTAESTSIACIEAMAAGRPVVASAVGGLVELVGENNERGVLVKMFDHTLSDYGAPQVDSMDVSKLGLLSSAISDLLINEDKSRVYAESSQKFAKNFDWSLITDRLLEVYKI